MRLLMQCQKKMAIRQNLTEMGKRMVVAGVNSGTSADGIDVCIAAWTFEENVATTADEGEVPLPSAPPHPI